MQIENSNREDIDEIFRLYRIATAYMKSKGMVSWPEFERTLVETEIVDKRQWKLLIENKIACIFATTFDDPLIWEERNADPSVYIHRIATNPGFRGQNLVLDIVKWSKEFARKHGKKFVRLDTVGKNEKLIAHYQTCGFTFLGLYELKNTEGLPEHYDKARVCLFELEVL